MGVLINSTVLSEMEKSVLDTNGKIRPEVKGRIKGKNTKVDSTLTTKNFISALPKSVTVSKIGDTKYLALRGPNKEKLCDIKDSEGKMLFYGYKDSSWKAQPVYTKADFDARVKAVLERLG